MTSLSLRTVVAAPAIWLIKGYQLVLSPMRPPTCRFYPSCSAYALTALERFGLIRGSWLAARRLLRCHPWNPGGVDHVPHPVASHDTAPTPHPAARPEYIGDQPVYQPVSPPAFEPSTHP